MSPIRPENRDRYPDDWKQIRERILERAAHRCEWCGKPNRQTVSVKYGGASLYDDNGLPAWWDADRRVWRCADTGRELRDEYSGMGALDFPSSRNVMVVLTIAHLDHVPENCAPDNLRALCQRCHNRYDAPHRARGRRERQGAAEKQPQDEAGT